MGECSDTLKQILTTLQTGLVINDGSGSASDLAREGGNLATIKSQTDKLSFDPATNELKVQASFETSEVNIGAFNIEDPDDSTAVNITTDGTKNAMFVQSLSLLKTSDFAAITGQAIESPDQYTANWRLKNLEAITTAIQNKVLALSFEKVRIWDGNDYINPATEGTLTSLKASTDLLAKEATLLEVKTLLNDVKAQNTIDNSVITTKKLSFAINQSAGTVLSSTDIVQPTEVKDKYLLNFVNASVETDVQIQLYLKETVNSTVVWCKFGDSFLVPKGPDTSNPGGASSPGTIAQQIEGAFLAEGLGISAKLVQATGATGAFDLDIVIREKN